MFEDADGLLIQQMAEEVTKSILDEKEREKKTSPMRFTPQSVASLQLNLWRSSVISREIDFGRVEVEGKYVETPGKEYSSGFYDLLEDANPCGNGKPVQLTLVMPGRLRSGLRSGQNYVFSGVMDAVPEYGGRWKAVFRVDAVVGAAANYVSPEDEEIFKKRKSLIDRKLERELRDVRKIVSDAVNEDRPLSVHLIYGAGAVVDSDVKKGLGHGPELHPVTITEERINMSKPESVAESVRKAPEADIVALVRGGGTGVEVFDHTDIAEAVLDSDRCIIAAIGHEKDHPFIEKIADRAFATPTDLGNILLQFIERAVEARDGSRGKLIEQVKKPYEEEISSLKKDREELGKKVAEMQENVAELNGKIRVEAEKQTALEKQFELRVQNTAKEYELKIRELELAAEKQKEELGRSEKTSGKPKMALVLAGFFAGTVLGALLLRLLAL